MVNEKRIEKGMYWDRALSLVEGCTPVSEGCAGCWAAAASYMRKHQQHPSVRARHAGLTTDRGHWTGEIRLLKENLKQLKNRRKSYVWSVWNDLFHPDVPDIFINDVFVSVEYYWQQKFLILTKRAKRMLEILEELIPNMYMATDPAGVDEIIIPENLFLGFTAENQERLDERAPHLLELKKLFPALKVWVSLEPLLGAIDIKPWLGWTGKNNGLPSRLSNELESLPDIPGIDGVVLGGETGKNARPMHPDWVRRVRDDCAEADIPFFFKQWGMWKPLGKSAGNFAEHPLSYVALDGVSHEGLVRDTTGMELVQYGRKQDNGRELDGVIHNDLLWSK